MHSTAVLLSRFGSWKWYTDTKILCSRPLRKEKLQHRNIVVTKSEREKNHGRSRRKSNITLLVIAFESNFSVSFCVELNVYKSFCQCFSRYKYIRSELIDLSFFSWRRKERQSPYQGKWSPATDTSRVTKSFWLSWIPILGLTIVSRDSLSIYSFFTWLSQEMMRLNQDCVAKDRKEVQERTKS
jgi:hypothetical protein